MRDVLSVHALPEIGRDSGRPFGNVHCGVRPGALMTHHFGPPVRRSARSRRLLVRFGPDCVLLYLDLRLEPARRSGRAKEPAREDRVGSLEMAPMDSDHPDRGGRHLHDRRRARSGGSRMGHRRRGHARCGGLDRCLDRRAKSPKPEGRRPILRTATQLLSGPQYPPPQPPGVRAGLVHRADGSLAFLSTTSRITTCPAPTAETRPVTSS